MITGTSTPRRRSSRQTSQPLIRGIMTSSSTRSGASLRASARASSPLVAATVWYPSKRRLSSRPRTISGSSSAIKILATARQGEPQGETAPRPRPALDRDPAAMRFGHVLDERQAHATAPLPLSFAPPHTVELLEDPPLLLGGDPHPLVHDRDREPGVGERRVHGDRAAVTRVLDRVVDQVGQRLADGVGVHRNLGQVGRHPRLDLEALLGEGVRERLERVPDPRLDGRRHHVVGPSPALDPREVEHVVDEPREPLALARDHPRSEEHTSELQSLAYLVCRLLLEKKKKRRYTMG